MMARPLNMTRCLIRGADLSPANMDLMQMYVLPTLYWDEEIDGSRIV